MSNGTPRGALRESGRPGSKRRRWPWVVTALVVVLAAAGVYVAFQNARSVTLAAFSPAPGAVLNSRPLTVSYALPRFVPGTGTVSLSVDGQALPADKVILQPELVQTAIVLPDGEHTVTLDYRSGNLFSRHLTRTWSFLVDTTPPEVSIASPASFPLLKARSTDLSLRLSEEAVVALTLDGDPVHVDPSGPPGRPLDAALTAGEGRHLLALRAVDQAGNVTTGQWQVLVDYRAPSVAVEGHLRRGGVERAELSGGDLHHLRLLSRGAKGRSQARRRSPRPRRRRSHDPE